MNTECSSRTTISSCQPVCHLWPAFRPSQQSLRATGSWLERVSNIAPALYGFAGVRPASTATHPLGTVGRRELVLPNLFTPRCCAFHVGEFIDLLFQIIISTVYELYVTRGGIALAQARAHEFEQHKPPADREITYYKTYKQSCSLPMSRRQVHHHPRIIKVRTYTAARILCSAVARPIGWLLTFSIKKDTSEAENIKGWTTSLIMPDYQKPGFTGLLQASAGLIQSLSTSTENWRRESMAVQYWTKQCFKPCRSRRITPEQMSLI